MTILIIVLIVLALGGGGFGYSRWGVAGGLSPIGAVLLVIFLLWIFGAFH